MNNVLFIAVGVFALWLLDAGLGKNFAPAWRVLTNGAGALNNGSPTAFPAAATPSVQAPGTSVILPGAPFFMTGGTQQAYAP